jgi:hypothetical protein
MKDYKKLLTPFIQTVTFLLAAFGGFLRKVAPPADVGAFYPVGILSFLTLIVLLIISTLGRRKEGETAYKPWLIAGIVLFVVALPTSFLYPHMLGVYTYPQNAPLESRKISASDAHLTTDARGYKSVHHDATAEELVQNFEDGDVWSKAGIEEAELQLLLCYAALVLSLAGAIFCLLEANSRRSHDT